LALRVGHPLRWFFPEVVYEITTRTLQERFLLRPSAESRELIIGIIARAQALYDIRIYAFFYMSNHAHLLVSANSAEQLALFTSYVNGLVGRKVGRLNGWRGKFWGRRARPIPILDDVELVARLRYVMAHGVKEGLVESVLDWPGASANPGLLGDMKLRGRWIDQDGLRAARRVQPEITEAEFTSYPVLELSPLPCWSDLSPDELRARHQQLADEIEEEARIARQGAPVLGVSAVLAKHPQAAPESSDHRPAPLCHTASPSIRERFTRAYRAFVAAFREAAREMRTLFSSQMSSSASTDNEQRHRWLLHRFPSGSTPRSGWAVPADRKAINDIVLDLAPRWSVVPNHV
jgi:REP element-mobilizing transposase RayT